MRILLDLGLARDQAEAIGQNAADSGTDLRKFLEAAGQVFDDKPEEARKSTRERYILRALKNTFNYLKILNSYR